MSPVEHGALNKDNEAKALLETAEKFEVGVRAQVEQLFRIIQMPIRIDQDYSYRGLNKTTAQLFTLSALSSLWIVRNILMGAGGSKSKGPERGAEIPNKGWKRWNWRELFRPSLTI